MSKNQLAQDNVALESKILIKEHSKVAISSFIGTTIEWYDFYLYGTAAALVFPALFFPNFDPIYGTMAAFGSYAAGFIARPLGSMVFGHYGDKLGRKKMLTISLLLMGLATFLMGFLPSYHSIGLLAPLLISLLRVIQGFAVGGEWGAAVVLAVEHAPPGKRGLYGSFPQMGVPAGLLLSTLVFSLVNNHMSNNAFLSWGWRIPFLCSAILIMVGLFVRLKVSESPVFLEAAEKKQQEERPVLTVLREQKKPLFLTIGMKLVQNAVFYIYTVFILSYIVNTLHMDRSVGLNAVMISSVIGLGTLPLWSYLSDKIGRKPVYLFGTIASTLFVIPFFWLMDSGSVLLITIGIVIGLNVFHDAVYGPQAVYYSELFGTKIRLSGASIGYQVGAVLAGGLSPIIATWLLAEFDGKSWPICLYLIALGVLSIVSTLFARETYRDYLT
ncbi:integral membrane transport protein [Bacillus methanolicus MGA3]|uniref:Putative proline/betaine transporter n=2 Tax=Bacillus methanolicus TaxID=1471 RepID=I3E925_BACMM|nr:integral membrane transporter [Bacillus methanolicus MGA3]EIJ82996.1 integral membrane transport protein [Bacillus methanolicus MGA3]